MAVRQLPALLMLLAAASAPAGELEHELLLFGDAQLVRASGVDVDDADVSDETIRADLIFSLRRGAFRMLGEYVGSNRESELERLQFGWEPSEQLRVWLGRMHQVTGAWSYEHHHGQFLQTSITRPAIEEWEDEGGIIPQHFTGLLLETNWSVGDGHGLEVAIGAGLAPALTAEGMEPFEVHTDGDNGYQSSLQARAAFRPNQLDGSSFGISLAHNELNWVGPIPAGLTGLDHVDQTVIGAFAHYSRAPWTLLGAVYHVAASLEDVAPRDESGSFLAGYLQVERDLGHTLEAFIRREDTRDAEDSPYVRLFENFTLSRTALGLRWEFARRHALTLEVGASETVLDDFVDFRLQWSGALL